MRQAGRIVTEVLDLIGANVRAGVTTLELDRMAEDLIRSRGGTPVFKGYKPPGRPAYPASTCISINDEVVHGIPSDRPLKLGDLVKVDVGVKYRLYIGDAARTFEVGPVDETKRHLVEVTRGALQAAIEVVRAGIRVSEISRAIQQHAESHGFSVVRQYSGHGVGRRMHEDPQIPNFVDRTAMFGQDPVLPAGATIAIEPMVNAGTWRTRERADRWCVVTSDGAPSAHFEDTVAVLEGCGEVLTR